MSAGVQTPSWGLFLNYLRPLWRKCAILAVLLFGGIGLQLVGPQLLAAFIDSATKSQGATQMIHLALLFLGVALVNQAAGVVTNYVAQDVGWTATNSLREDLALHCLRLDMTFHNTHTPGELIERVDGDLTALANFFSIFLLRVVGSGLLLLGAVIVILAQNWRVGLVLLGFVVVTLTILVVMRRLALPAGIQERVANATFTGFLEERLAGVDDLRANGGNAYVMRRYYETMRDWFHRSVNAWMRRSWIWGVTTLLFALENAALFAISAVLFFHHDITLGMAYLFFQYNVMLQGPLEEITQQMQEMQKAASSLVRVRELLSITPTIRDGVGTIPDGPLAVEFAGVDFAYNVDDGAVLHDLTFRLEPGQTLGLLGRTGSGKTTISRLIFRLYDLNQGTIRLNGVDVRDATLTNLREHIGLITQEVQLFHASVRDNLTFFDSSIDDARIMAVIAETGLDDWFSRLADGLDTELDAGGSGLSAGESQLLAFVRVFLKDPGLVILDEPSSRLDPATEAVIERGMRKLLQGRTGIIIAHRLATVQRVDSIMILDRGNIREFGARSTLLRDTGSRFHKLSRIGLEEVLA